MRAALKYTALFFAGGILTIGGVFVLFYIAVSMVFFLDNHFGRPAGLIIPALVVVFISGGVAFVNAIRVSN